MALLLYFKLEISNSKSVVNQQAHTLNLIILNFHTIILPN